MNWDDVSDFEVNKAVAKALGFKVYKQKIGGGEYRKTIDVQENERGGKLFLHDYCNSWADMGPIIYQHGISLIKWCEPDEGYEASIVNYYSHGSVYEDMFYSDTNPLRAAAIVFLMMNGVKPENLT